MDTVFALRYISESVQDPPDTLQKAWKLLNDAPKEPTRQLLLLCTAKPDDAKHNAFVSLLPRQI